MPRPKRLRKEATRPNRNRFFNLAVQFDDLYPGQGEKHLGRMMDNLQHCGVRQREQEGLLSKVLDQTLYETKGRHVERGIDILWDNLEMTISRRLRACIARR